MKFNPFESLQSLALEQPNYRNQKLAMPLSRPSSYPQRSNPWNLNIPVETKNTPLAKSSWNNTTMRHLNKRSLVNPQTIEEVTPNDLAPKEMDIVEEEEVITDLALFEVEAVERGLSTHNQTVPLLCHPTTMPTKTPSNTGIRQPLTIQQYSTSTTTKKLLSSEGWDLTWRLPIQVCTQLEEDHQSTLAVINHSGGLPVTVYKESISLEGGEKDPLPSCRTISSGCSSGQISESRHHISITNSEQRLPLQLFRNPGTVKASSDIGLRQIEQIPSNSTFQDERYSSSQG